MHEKNRVWKSHDTVHFCLCQRQQLKGTVDVQIFVAFVLIFFSDSASELGVWPTFFKQPPKEFSNCFRSYLSLMVFGTFKRKNTVILFWKFKQVGGKSPNLNSSNWKKEVFFLHNGQLWGGVGVEFEHFYHIGCLMSTLCFDSILDTLYSILNILLFFKKYQTIELSKAAHLVYLQLTLSLQCQQ